MPYISDIDQIPIRRWYRDELSGLKPDFNEIRWIHERPRIVNQPFFEAANE